MNRLLLTAMALLHAFSVFALANASVPLSLHEEGTLHNAPYGIKVPLNWNGILLLYVRGTGRTTNPVGLNPLVGVAGLPPDVNERQAAELEHALLADGYALAASAFPEDGGAWFIKEGMRDTQVLTNYFKSRVGKPDKTILWSRSQGTIIGLEFAEKFPGLYDASIAGCAVGAGAPRTWDLTLDILLAWEAAFGFPPEWGTPGDVRDDLNFRGDVLPIIMTHIKDPAQFGLFEFLRLASGAPLPGFYPTGGTAPEASWLMSLMYFSTEVRAEVEKKARGRVAQNLDHFYELTHEEKAYLQSLGADADRLLEKMNSRGSRYAAQIHARNYNKRYADFSGNLGMPVLTLHTTRDGLVNASHESAYRQTVESAGKGHMLVQVFADAVGHCTFTPRQWSEAIKAVVHWLDTGITPGPEFFTDFDQTFVPPVFPNP